MQTSRSNVTVMHPLYLLCTNILISFYIQVREEYSIRVQSQNTTKLCFVTVHEWNILHVLVFRQHNGDDSP
jgi:hypothetical protein